MHDRAHHVQHEMQPNPYSVPCMIQKKFMHIRSCVEVVCQVCKAYGPSEVPVHIWVPQKKQAVRFQVRLQILREDQISTISFDFIYRSLGLTVLLVAPLHSESSRTIARKCCLGHLERFQRAHGRYLERQMLILISFFFLHLFWCCAACTAVEAAAPDRWSSVLSHTFGYSLRQVAGGERALLTPAAYPTSTYQGRTAAECSQGGSCGSLSGCCGPGESSLMYETISFDFCICFCAPKKRIFDIGGEFFEYPSRVRKPWGLGARCVLGGWVHCSNDSSSPVSKQIEKRERERESENRASEGKEKNTQYRYDTRIEGTVHRMVPLQRNVVAGWCSQRVQSVA